MNFIWLETFVLTLMLSTFGQCDKYLILHPFYSGSHVLTLHHVAKALVERGHQVVTLRFLDTHQFKLKDLGPAHREIVLALDNQDGHLPFVSVEKRGKFGMPVELLWQEGLTLSAIFKLPKNPWSVVSAFCHTLLSNETLVEELKSEQFDLVIVDLIYNECSLALAANSLDIPAVAYWAFSFSSGEAEYTTMATPPSHVPAFMSEVSHQMTFMERMWNTAIKFFWARPFMMLHTRITDSLIHQYYPDSIGSADLIANLNGAMINTNFVLDYPRLQPTTFINVGGMQISETPNALPPDILDFILSAGDKGVILFTMGFIFQPEAVPDSRIQAIFNALAQLPQKVIMKLDPPEHLQVPANVMTKSFLPQADILAHKNVVLFITHCGMHGVMEAIYHNVPMVGMPVFIDQGDILARIQDKGIGKGISKWATTEEIVSAVQEVLQNPMYEENVAQLSKLMKLGMKQKPMENVIWWLEYLSATKGAEHLKLASRHLNLIQYFSLDFLFIVLMSIALCLKCVMFCLSRKRQKKKKKD